MEARQPAPDAAPGIRVEFLQPRSCPWRRWSGLSLQLIVQLAPDGRPGPNLAQASSGAARPSARTVSFPPPDYGGGDPRPALLPPAGWCAATRSGTSSTASARSSSRSHGPRPRLTRTSTARGAVPVASFSVRRRTPARGKWLDLPEAAAMAPV